MMNKQIQIYSVDGDYFYNEQEDKIYKEKFEHLNIASAIERFELYKLLEAKEQKYKFNSYIEIKELYEMKFRKDFTDEERKKFNTKKYVKKFFTQIENKYYDKLDEVKNKLKESNEVYNKAKSAINSKDKELSKLLELNTEVRSLNAERLTKYDVISLFDSNLTRTLKLKANELSKDLVIVNIGRFIIMENLIEKGFYWDDEHYVFLTASAGQIRKQKIVMIKESVYKTYINILSCGLTLEIINEAGGANVNKYLAYLSLNDSATDVWEEFNIDQCIVLPDFKTDVIGTVDYINTVDVIRKFDVIDKKGNKVLDENGKVKKEMRTVKALSDIERRENMSIPIEHSDGCGWILPELSKVNFMCRLPWIKGLLTPCNFIKWQEEFNDEEYKAIDIYGKEWDLKSDNIKIIFFKSQFKMSEYYKNTYDNNGNVIEYGWDKYKNEFKKGCKANKCKVEPLKAKDFKKARFNYQMLQTLVGMENSELIEFVNPISKLITDAYTDRETQLKLLGADNTNKKMTNLQKAIMMYPALMKDYHIQEELSDKISAIKNNARQAKFPIDGFYTFIIPDIFAWMEYSLGNKKVPQGLLNDGQVFCNLFKKEKQLLVNRSPHCYAEHAVRENYTGYKEYKGKQILLSEWFTTNGVYISSHDLITKLIQCDNDGDQSLVIKGSLVDIADREMKKMNIVPLYYEMDKAPKQIIDSDSIIKSLKSAFKFGNIGEYSNKLTKLWNSEDRDIKVAAMLTALNNFFIDGAKTNYCPDVYSKIETEIKCMKDKLKQEITDKKEFLKNNQSQIKATILNGITDKEIKKEKLTELNDLNKLQMKKFSNELKVEHKSLIEIKQSELVADDMTSKIKAINKHKMPYFFKYAKDYKENKLNPINDSVVNRACKMIDEIPRKQKFYFGIERFNWHYLTNNFKVNIESDKAASIIENYEILNSQIQSYFAKAKEDKVDDYNVQSMISARVYTTIRQEFEKYINTLGVGVVDATDVIVRYIYTCGKKDRKKAFLFNVLGDMILKNIEKHIMEKRPKKKVRKGFVLCACCGKEVEKLSNRQKYCEDCSKEMIRQKDRKRKKTA